MVCDFLSTLSTTYLLVAFPNLKTIFFVLHLLNFFFLFLLPLSTFKPLNALYLKLMRLKISGRTSVRQKSGVPGWGISLNRVIQNFELLTVRARWIKFSEWVNIKNKLTLTKIGSSAIGAFPNGPSKIQTFQPLKLDT